MKRIIPCLLMIAACAAPARAQAPTIAGVFPPGGQAGTEAAVTISGANLADVQTLLVSGEGVRAEKGTGGDASNCPVKLTLAPDAGVGMREIRVLTAKGASNAGRIWVGRYPDVIEKEPNDRRDQAQVLERLPATVNGRGDKAEDADFYAFDAAAGETWVFSIAAARYVSSLDAYLSLHDGRGRLLGYAMDAFERDPRLIHTFARAGRYVLQVRDSMYRGGPAFTYRLTVGKQPVITRWSPMGGRRGSTLSVALKGVNLGDMAGLQVTLPADPAQERLRVVPKTPLGPANPIDLFLSDLPEAVEKEPNDAPGAALRLPALPGAVSGWIDRKGDRDVVAFSAKEKQALLLEVQARRVGSRLDSVLRILDASGKELASNDDGAGKDSRLVFTAPAAGEYFAELRSLSSRGGDEFFYRLQISDPPAPDFSLAITPDNPTAPAGAAIAVTVTAARSAFNGPIALRVEGLPAGVTAAAPEIREGQSTAVIALSAAPDAKPAGAALRVIGTAKIGERMVSRVAQGQEQYQPPLTNNANQARTRETEMAVAAVGPEPPYRLAVTPAAMEVKAGQNLVLTVKVTRKDGYKENVAVSVMGLPPNVTASALTVNGNQAEGKITLTTKGNAAVGPALLVIQGNAKNVLAAAPPLTIAVQPAK